MKRQLRAIWANLAFSKYSAKTVVTKTTNHLHHLPWVAFMLQIYPHLPCKRVILKSILNIATHGVLFLKKTLFPATPLHQDLDSCSKLSLLSLARSSPLSSSMRSLKCIMTMSRLSFTAATRRILSLVFQLSCYYTGGAPGLQML